MSKQDTWWYLLRPIWVALSGACITMTILLGIKVGTLREDLVVAKEHSTLLEQELKSSACRLKCTQDLFKIPPENRAWNAGKALRWSWNCLDSCRKVTR